MRALLAAALSLLIALAALGPHVHGAGGGAEECAVCVVSGRGAEPAKAHAPELAPASFLAGAPALAQPLPPVCGAPLGAVPGQSPPRA